MATKKKATTSGKKPAAKKAVAKGRGSGAGGRVVGTDPKRVAAILEKLDEAYPDAVCELKHESPFQLLISTILSAQCTDVRVNQVTAELYKKYTTPEAFAYANPAELEKE